MKEYIEVLIIVVPVIFGIMYKICKWAIKMIAFFKRIHSTLEIIEKEFRPNGGLSIKDCITRIENNQILSDKRGRLLMNNFNRGIFETNAKGEYIWVNRKYEEITGQDLEEIYGNNWVNHIDDSDNVLKLWKSAVEEKRIFDYKYKVNDIFVHCQASPIYDVNKKLIGYIGTLTPYENNKV